MMQASQVPYSQIFSGCHSQLLVKILCTFLFWWVCIPKANEYFASSNVQILPLMKKQGKILKINLNEKKGIIWHRGPLVDT